MLVFLILGLFVIIIGLMLIFTPSALFKLNNHLNKNIFTDKDIFRNRTAFAVIILAVGVLMVFTYLQHIIR